MGEDTEKPPEKPAPPPPPPEPVLPALAHFEHGDWVSAGIEARHLQSDADPQVQAAARELLARMAPDPWAIRVGLLALALLVILGVVYI